MINISTVVLTAIIAVVSFIVLSLFIDPLVKKIRCSLKTSPAKAMDAPLKPKEPECECESECYGNDCFSGVPMTLLSRGKPVKVTPAWQSYPGSNLTDGEYETFAQSADWISTKNVSAEVDLGKEYTIRKIKIFNRMDCCQDRFGPHSLYIDGKKIGTGDARGAWEYEYCVALTGTKVKIEMDGILNLSQIEVWGY